MPFPISGQFSRSFRHGIPAATSAPVPDADARRLALAVGRGDETAFRELYDRYHRRLFRFVLVLGGGDESLANEIVQSVFVTAAARLRRVKNEEHLWNWLARVARQQCIKAWRHRRQHSSLVDPAALPDLAAPLETDSLLEERLETGLLALEAEERQVIEWFYFEGMSHKEIAVQLGATPKAVSSRLERARARLRSLLKRTLSHEA